MFVCAVVAAAGRSSQNAAAVHQRKTQHNYDCRKSRSELASFPPHLMPMQLPWPASSRSSNSFAKLRPGVGGELYYGLLPQTVTQITISVIEPHTVSGLGCIRNPLYALLYPVMTRSQLPVTHVATLPRFIRHIGRRRRVVLPLPGGRVHNFVLAACGRHLPTKEEILDAQIQDHGWQRSGCQRRLSRQ